jgi:heat shock protein HtpX
MDDTLLLSPVSHLKYVKEEKLMGNIAKTTLLLAGLTGLFLAIGGLIGGKIGLIIAFGLAVVMNMGAWWFSDSIALKMSGAQKVSRSEAPELHAMVESLAQNAGLPKPTVCIINNSVPNAFATGRNPSHSAVAVTTGIMQMLDKDELAGVISHELAHIKNRDTLISSIAATLAGAVTMLADMAMWALIFGGFGGDDEEGGGIGGLVGGILMIFLAPIAAMIIQMAISRSREYGADAGGAQIMGNPLPLARALEKLEMAARQMSPMRVNPSTSHLYIVNPLRGGGLAELFSTHPNSEKRIQRLRDMA